MVIQAQAKVTVEQFEAFIARPENQDRRFELINGEIIEKAMPTEEHGAIAAKLAYLLGQFIYASNLGRLTVESRHRKADDPANTRVPDVAFTQREHMQPVTTEGAAPYMPDLCIEIKSPDDTYKGLRDKAAYYLSAGVSMVWLIIPEKRLIETYTKDEQAIFTAAANDSIGGGAVLPGLVVAVKDVFEYE